MKNFFIFIGMVLLFGIILTYCNRDIPTGWGDSKLRDGTDINDITFTFSTNSTDTMTNTTDTNTATSDTNNTTNTVTTNTTQSVTTDTNQTTSTTDTSTTTTATIDEWTIMIYMNADNVDDFETQAIEDMNELEDVDLSSTTINVCVLLDRITGNDTSNGDWIGAKFYQISYDSNGQTDLVIRSTAHLSTYLNIIDTNGISEPNMGDTGTLRNFILECQSSYPAQNYALFIWFHGSSSSTNQTLGAFNGILKDTSAGSFLTPSSSRLALDGLGVSLVGFDVGYSAMTELIYELRTKTDYIVASETGTPDDGWEYHTILSDFAAKPSKTPLELGKSIVDAYNSTYSGSSVAITLFEADATKIDTLKTSIDTMTGSITSMLPAASGSGNDLANVRDTVTRFRIHHSWDGTNTQWFADAVDLYDFADKLQTAGSYSGCDTVKTNITAIKSYEYIDATLTGANGLSIYYPEYLSSASFYNCQFAGSSSWSDIVGSSSY